MKIIDLTYEIYHQMPKFWGDYHPEVEVSITGTYEKNHCLVRKLVLGTHTGTHIDAPAHFCRDGLTIDKIPFEAFICPARVFDFTHKGAKSEIGLEETKDIEISPGEAAILATGWDKHWGVDFYQDFPNLQPQAAKKLLEKGAIALAVDFPLGIEVHKIILGAGKIIVENLTSLNRIKTKRVKLIALPLKLKEGDAAPARVLAVEEEEQ